MRTVAEEYRRSPFYENNLGLRVPCADCHVPKPLVAKPWRKMKASREVYHKVMGTMDTPEKFEARRIMLAGNEWKRFRESDSRECRHCHSYAAMTIDEQPNDAHCRHPVAMDEGYTCIDCHKGFVHRLPNLEGEIQKAGERFEAALAADTLAGNALYVARTAALHSEPRAEQSIIAELEPGTPVTVLARNDGWFRVRVQGRQYQSNYRTLYEMGDHIAPLALGRDEILTTTDEPAIRDSATGLDWRPADLEGWVSRQALTSEISSLWDYGKALYQNGCVRCHVVFSPSDFWATQWKNHIRNMRRKVDLGTEQTNILLGYLQHHAKPQGQI
uniref:Trimethylamine-N-oxide reductase (Cytochrome c), cytochrome c-type subunit TorC n=1 Tax=Candidatus Kentrum eta TaxID=2126337 RepID=A0A450V9V1_9GAMM|nr:MAG: trimethylamine-N-oxide reductase (cytochrome c), cytochrome c-type subunit TorC [Candidatus Kentron sp. H]VFK01560.1 MAG: trimethylamine-N-oxide reductase (cytochrome c), cytochrome c-type subunit TorC [Candidatus Kentron sp. H]VFK03981.1 MAG: trimethylamine-N-oxide reductase (cytochrome c), cytochrome c-type subunit TorC [Candidatus Kentron sp. H]